MFRPLALMLLCGVAVSACTPLRGHQGYVVDADLVNSIQPGVDNRQSVQQVLGLPTLAGQFNQGDWYYVARDTRNFAFNNPKPVQQSTLRVRFNDAGVVTAIDRMGLEQIASISPSKKKTPTLGRERGFFADLFGNIGTVGAAGAPPGGPQ
ncbi:outer membrane protein assembly factor BamE [Sphingomonas floccifaciens]|uniref:Outer membrane protein assembly factor BamE n=1 Tax=Sphingomonas floccifaciens TaxID=1844115 RepID=A0ABW4NJ46_9SPHN